MFEIDLLKGEGVPVKSRPESIAFGVAMVIVPLAVLAVIFGCFLRNRIVISVQESRIAGYEAKIDKLEGAVDFEQSIRRQKQTIRNSLEEVSETLGSGRYVQWTPVLVSVIENLPEVVALTSMEVKKRTVKKQVPSKKNPEQMVHISVPLRRLQMNLRGNIKSDCDKAIREYRSRLYSSDVLGPKLENIRVSQKMDTVNGQEFISYVIDCVFKAGS